MTPEEAVKQLSPEMASKMAWSYLLSVCEHMGGTRDTLQKLPVPPEMFPGLSWPFLMGIAAREILRMGATPE